MVDNLPIVATAAAEASLQLALLPHLDYRAVELVEVMERVDHPALRMAFDTANPFPVCEEPVEAARIALPHAVAIALKDVQIYPQRSNDVNHLGDPHRAGFGRFQDHHPTVVRDPSQSGRDYRFDQVALAQREQSAR